MPMTTQRPECGLEISWAMLFRPRAKFCPIWRALEDLDQFVAIGMSGVAVRAMVLEETMAERDRIRVKAFQRGSLMAAVGDEFENVPSGDV